MRAETPRQAARRAASIISNALLSGNPSRTLSAFSGVSRRTARAYESRVAENPSVAEAFFPRPP